MYKLPIYLDCPINYEESFELYKQCSAKAHTYNSLPPKKAENSDFYSDFLGSMIQRPSYSFCRFHKSPFIASNGAYSFFNNCDFYDCFFKDTDFRYGYFEKCRFIQQESFKIEGTGFNYSSFSENKFQNIRINGCSFRYMEIVNTKFKKCEMKNSSFEHCNITNCTFEDMDLRNIGIRYNTFSNVTFKNVIFPILDMTCNFDLLKEFQCQPDAIRFSMGNNNVISYFEALQLLQRLIPYYIETKQYFHVINILWLNKDQENFKIILPIILDYSVKNNDFETLKNICSLIVKTGMLDDEHLRDVYIKIKGNVIPENLPPHLYKSYNFYMESIKNILYINPNNDPVLQISLETDISSNDISELMPILETIENSIKEISPTLYPRIELIHHSPYDILIFLCGHQDYLLQIAQIFYYTIGGINCLNKMFNPKHGKIAKGDSIEYEEVNSVFELSVKGFININIKKNIKGHTKTVEHHISIM